VNPAQIKPENLANIDTATECAAQNVPLKQFMFIKTNAVQNT
jgi:hypothetical protein